jgi:rRNA-processing protein EBP2
MVTKSKLKMALVADKGVDFKKEKQKKLAKLARKEKRSKGLLKDDVKEASKLNGAEEEDSEEEDEEGLAELEAMEMDEDDEHPEVRALLAVINRVCASASFILTTI